MSKPEEFRQVIESRLREIRQAAPTCSRPRSDDYRYGRTQADPGARRLRGQSRSRDAAGRGAAEARVAAARLSARLLDRRAAAVERLGAQLCRRWSAAPAPRTSCSRRERLNPQHATFLNVTFGSSFDADDTHVGAMLHPGVAVWSAALAIGEHVGAAGPRGAGRGRGRLRDHHPDRARDAARPFQARLPEHRHLRRVRHRRSRRPAAVPRAGCRAAHPRGDRARRQLLQRGRAILLFGLLRQAHPGRARGAVRRRGGAAHPARLRRAGRHPRRHRRLCPRLWRRMGSVDHRERARPALPSHGCADEVPRRRRARRGRHRRHAGAAPARTASPATTSPPCISASRASSRAA